MADTAVEERFTPGYWECLVDGTWTPYAWLLAAGIEGSLRCGAASHKFRERDFPYEIRFSEPWGPGLNSKIVLCTQVNLQTKKERQARRFPSWNSKQRLETEKLVRARTAWNGWHQTYWAWPLCDASDAAASSCFSPPSERLARVWPLPSQLSGALAGPLGQALGPYGARLQGAPQSPFLRGIMMDGGLGGFALSHLGTDCSEDAHAEVALIKKCWNEGGLAGSFQLIGAMRIVNRGVFDFAALHERMRDSFASDESRPCRRSSSPEVLWLWHGTKNVASLLDICADGFDRALAATCLYGKGCYFASSASFANRYAGDVVHAGSDGRKVRALILAAVLCGDCVKGSNNLYPPPLKPGSATGERYENTVDSVDKPSIWVTYRDNQAIPCYIVVFEALNR